MVSLSVLTRIGYLFIIWEQDLIYLFPSLPFCLARVRLFLTLQLFLYLLGDTINGWCQDGIASVRCHNMRLELFLGFEKALASLALMNYVVPIEMASAVKTIELFL